MNRANVLELGIVIGLASHPQTVMEGLWEQALEALAGQESRLRAVIVFVDDGSQPVLPPSPLVTVVALKPKAGGRLRRLASSLSRKQGALGVVGRLMRDNLYSRSVAKSLAAQRQAVVRLCAADVVVSADTAADRAVWCLRKRSSGKLMHGPFAMMTALRATNAVQSSPESFSSGVSANES